MQSPSDPCDVFYSSSPQPFGNRDQFCGRQFFYRLWCGGGRGGWFQNDSSALPLLCTLFLLLLLHQLHTSAYQALDPGGWGPCFIVCFETSPIRQWLLWHCQQALKAPFKVLLFSWWGNLMSPKGQETQWRQTFVLWCRQGAKALSNG